MQCLKRNPFYTLLVKGSPRFIRIESSLSIVTSENNSLVPKMFSLGCFSQWNLVPFISFNVVGRVTSLLHGCPSQWSQLFTITTLWKSHNPSSFLPFERVNYLFLSYPFLLPLVLQFLCFPLCSFIHLFKWTLYPFIFSIKGVTNSSLHISQPSPKLNYFVIILYYIIIIIFIF